MRFRKTVALATSALTATGALMLSVPAASAADTRPAPAASLLGACNYNGSHPELSPGDTGAAVSHAQCLLKHVRGYDVDIDGIFGPNTATAVRKAQRACGIAVDGIIGPNTWDCLHGHL
ncbi:peptidoglycan-binding domain-containing protein [Streptomyces sp. DSM 42041]|uniref:Peptidoglycan-binding domain-containing protein n=1 Tax=Streptomyces hazeniae TaxID=3075538 RepID=A0ABU2NPE8_9ACTN|nr:peptidoglycan-binding domain-containing protein [Streptomyces sp. DSM 42041]MDT0378634.1 peptidoglycan-binding domain-containing protein [Streptomyces sp. DSM 42041]